MNDSSQTLGRLGYHHPVRLIHDTDTYPLVYNGSYPIYLSEWIKMIRQNYVKEIRNKILLLIQRCEDKDLLAQIIKAKLIKASFYLCIPAANP